MSTNDESVYDLFCRDKPMNPNADANNDMDIKFYYIMLLISDDPETEPPNGFQNAFAICVMLATMLVHALLLRRACKVKMSIRSVSTEFDCENKPTYCTLTVFVISTL